ncbi:MAG: hypothetical protein L6E13_13140 [Firmicutes bacterium]|nr:hypothetical protein [Bacillota bacterium]
MAISWTHTIEERLSRLERRQERLMAKLAALADALRQQPPPGTGAAPAGPAAGAGDAQPAASRPSPPSASGAPGPAARYGPQAGPGKGQGSAAGAPSARVPKDQSPGAAPMAGGQVGSLGMWQPSPEASAPEHRAEVLRRVDELAAAVQTVSAATQRLQVMCDLLGHCVYVAVDPEAAAQRLQSRGLVSLGGLPADGSGTPGGTGGPTSDLAGALAGLLPGLLARAVGQSGSGTGGEPGPEGAADGGAGGSGALGSGGADGGGGAAGDTGGGDTGATSGTPGGQEAGPLPGLLPLMQAVVARSGGEGAAARLGAVVGSPAFQQLVGMVQASGGAASGGTH